MVSFFRDEKSLTGEQLKSRDGRSDIVALDAVALTVVSACVGIQAASWSDTPETGVKIASLIVALFMYHRMLRSFYNLIYFRQFKRAPIVLTLFFPSMVVIAIYVGEIIGNLWLGVGLLFGWLLSFLFLLIWIGDFKTAEPLERSDD